MEDIDISREVTQTPDVEVHAEGHHFAPYIGLAFGLMILAVVVFFASQYITLPVSPFNIPTDTNNVIIFDQDTLYAYEPDSGDLRELGSFEVSDIKEASISSDLSSIALASEEQILIFTSYDDIEFTTTSIEEIKNISVSNSVVLFSTGELSDNNERKIYRATADKKEIFTLGTTPVFLDSGFKAVVGTSDGFRMFDFEVQDKLDTETPLIPTANSIQSSRSGDKIALVSTSNSVHVYDVLSTRPLQFLEDFFLVTPSVIDAAVADTGVVAYLRSSEGAVFISIYDPETKESFSRQLQVSADAKILIWSK